jgi:nucleoside 2-deoxyribosyltransferase
MRYAVAADLSDDNAGAYWEAGFAEGLGKPVIYICREGVNTHFDTDHRRTVRWSTGDWMRLRRA